MSHPFFAEITGAYDKTVGLKRKRTSPAASAKKPLTSKTANKNRVEDKGKKRPQPKTGYSSTQKSTTPEDGELTNSRVVATILPGKRRKKSHSKEALAAIPAITKD